MKICLVTAFPPSRHGLNEYGFHIARELSQYPGLSLSILSDDLPSPEAELPGYDVTRCWAFESVRNPIRLIGAIKKCRPDVVWFNLGFASFGSSPVPAFIGLAIPAMVRMLGYYTHVTLHQLVETVDLNDARVKSQTLYRVAGSIATHILLTANSLSVLLPAYRKILREKYRRGSVYVRAHGILSGRPEYPDLSKRGNPIHRILAFGKWGTYKRLELLLESFSRLTKQVPNVELTISGGDHPKTPGYVASVAAQHKDNPKINFTGYVPEEAIPALFQGASLAVMPYTSSAGSSGVAHLACEYGVPIVASDIQDFHELASEEGIAIAFYKAGSVEALTERLLELLQSREQLEIMAMQNFSAALRMSMPEIIRQYIRSFDLQNRVKMLQSASRFRRVPRWMPLRPAWRRHVGQKLASWHESEFASYLDATATQRFSAESQADGNGKHPGVSIPDDIDVVDDTLPTPTPLQGAQAAGQNGNGKHSSDARPAQGIDPRMIDEAALRTADHSGSQSGDVGKH
jgi:glycosyltransferase involved in cell wall biosynthesis